MQWLTGLRSSEIYTRQSLGACRNRFRYEIRENEKNGTRGGIRSRRTYLSVIFLAVKIVRDLDF